MTIIRYKNRKLYCIELHKYVTARHLLNAVKMGIAISITDNVSGKDITASILMRELANDKRLNASQIVRFIREAA